MYCLADGLRHQISLSENRKNDLENFALPHQISSVGRRAAARRKLSEFDKITYLSLLGNTTFSKTEVSLKILTFAVKNVSKFFSRFSRWDFHSPGFLPVLPVLRPPCFDTSPPIVTTFLSFAKMGQKNLVIFEILVFHFPVFPGFHTRLRSMTILKTAKLSSKIARPPSKEVQLVRRAKRGEKTAVFSEKNLISSREF